MTGIAIGRHATQAIRLPAIYRGCCGLSVGAALSQPAHVPALEASTLLLVEPVFNPIWTWLAHGERPSSLALLGGGIIIITALTGAWWQSRADQVMIT